MRAERAEQLKALLGDKAHVFEHHRSGMLVGLELANGRYIQFDELTYKAYGSKVYADKGEAPLFVSDIKEECFACAKKDKALKQLRSAVFEAHRKNPGVFKVAEEWLTIIQNALQK